MVLDSKLDLRFELLDLRASLMLTVEKFDFACRVRDLPRVRLSNSGCDYSIPRNAAIIVIFNAPVMPARAPIV